MLNAANGWKHTWTKLETGHEYTVVEASVPSSYNALVDRENNDYTVTNTAKPESAKTGANVAIIAGIVIVLAIAGIAISMVVRRKNSADDADAADASVNGANGSVNGDQSVANQPASSQDSE